MTELIVIGVGQAFREHYSKVLLDIPNLRVVGIVDPAIVNQQSLEALLPGVSGDVWVVGDVSRIPGVDRRPDVAVMILTPDHYPVIARLAAMGFKKMLVEKPLVSRDSEVEKVMLLRDEEQLKLYAIDFYIPKLFPLLVAFGIIGEEDPRRKFVGYSLEVSKPLVSLGKIEGIAVQVIEAGSFCIPDLDRRPWLENDQDIGGMLRDLGTHALAPLIAAGLLDSSADIHETALSKLNHDRSRMIPLEPGCGVEMHVSALLSSKGIPIQVAFGKVPFEGGIWSLAVRGENGMFYAGLRTGQRAVLVPNQGAVVEMRLTQSTYRIVIEEALMYFNGELPGFDGNVGAFSDSMRLLQKIREEYSLRFVQV